MSALRTPQFWLAKLDQYGNPTLTDGPHSNRDGVEQAAYLLNRLGLTKERQFVCAEVALTDVEPKAHDANEEALDTLNQIGLRPTAVNELPAASMAFHNGLRILMGIEAHELIRAGVFDNDTEAILFMQSPFMGAIRLGDTAYANLWALMVKRGMKA